MTKGGSEFVRRSLETDAYLRSGTGSTESLQALRYQRLNLRLVRRDSLCSALRLACLSSLLHKKFSGLLRASLRPVVVCMQRIHGERSL